MPPSAEKEKGYPTPAVGTPIIWYPGADTKNGQVAGVCTRQEQSGKIGIAVFKHRSMIQYIDGCHHLSHPIHDKKGDSSRRNGAWDFVDNSTPRGVYKLARKEEEAREKSRKEQESRQKARDRERASVMETE